MQNRRDFLKTLSLIGGTLVFDFRSLLAKPLEDKFFGLNEFIENNPDAVFIFRTNVDSKTNTDAIRQAGLQLSQSLFQIKPDASSGLPVGTNVVFKPNITWWAWDKTPIEEVMGIHTDPNFVEGMIERLKELSVKPQNIYIREGNYHGADSVDGKYYGIMAARANVNLKNISAGIGKIDESDIQWTDVPNGIWFKKIPYIWPICSSGSVCINISKMKSHSMGMTLCSKNIQGAIVDPYIRHCTGWNVAIPGVNMDHIVPDATNAVKANYERHKKAGIPRWDIPGDSAGGLWMETWASRCLDNNSTLKPILNMVEGIYSREGGFVSGPDNGYGRDILTNIVIFGKNSFHVDIVGTYIAGHEPGNFGLFHMAKESKLSNYLNPHDIPLFEWKADGTSSKAILEDFPRTNIRTQYLQKAGEEQYHMVNEAYDYTTSISESRPKPAHPDLFAIYQNFPNPFNPSTSIRFYIPEPGSVLLEIFDVTGSRIAVLTDTYMRAGDHLTVWNSNNVTSGIYYYRMSYQGQSITKSMMLLR